MQNTSRILNKFHYLSSLRKVVVAVCICNNYIWQHMALKEKIPAGIKVEGQNKRLTPIQNAAERTSEKIPTRASVLREGQ